MSQNPPWPPQGGQPGPQPQGPYQPQGPPAQSHPQQGGGYPQQGGGYSGQQAGQYPPQSGQYPQQAGQYPPQSGQYPPQGGYPQSGQQGYPPGPGGGYSGPFAPQTHPGQGGYPPHGGGTGGSGGSMGSQPPRKSTGLIIGIVVAALVLLIVIGGIIMAVAGGGKDEPISTITPSAPPTPTTPPSPTTKPSATPTSTPTTKPTAAPSSSKPTDKPTKPPSGAAVDLGNGVKLTPAADWKVRSKKSGAAQLSNGEDVFVGIAAKLPKGSNPSQTCTGYHKELAKDYTNAKFADPENVDLGSKKLKGATCAAQVTVANGGDAVQVTIVSLVSIRTDGLTVVGSLYFTKNSDTKQLNSDFATMVNSMLKTQVAGG